MKRRARGFTLVELMVSLVMGLIVALAAVALAKTATTTFYEQARISGVEANIRAASERLRSDLSRASYMSTPNIQFDRTIAKVPGGSAAYRVPTLQNLQSVRILPASDTNFTNHPFTTANPLTPQEIIITGNLTSDDSYRGQLIAQAGSAATIRLSASADAAVRRLFAGATDSNQARQMAQLVFTPGEAMVPAVPDVAYAVQVMDMRGCFHYLTTGAAGVTVAPAAGTDIRVDINLVGDPALGILSPADTNGDVCGARLMEEVAIAPVHRVRWTITPETDTRRIDPAHDLPAGGGPVGKFNLVRQLLTSDTTAAAPTAVGPAEIIAEYAIDLRFGLVLDNTGNGPTPAFVNFEAPPADFETWTGRVSTLTNPAIGPQRIRTVRYRLAFRAPLADRTTDLPMGPPGTPYLARYCMGAPCTQYARVRTIISEVALINQAKAL